MSDQSELAYLEKFFFYSTHTNITDPPTPDSLVVPVLQSVEVSKKIGFFHEKCDSNELTDSY